MIRLAPANRSLCDWPLVAGVMAMILAASVRAQPTTAPAVYRQPADSAAKWTARGVRTAICYEPSGGSVSAKDWEAAWVKAGAKVIREPSGDYKADDADPNLLGILSPIQEADNAVVTAHDVAAAAGKDPAPFVEAVYSGLEGSCRQIRAAAPHKPVVILLALEQLRWGKADYKRLVAAADYVVVDWYPILRGLTPADYGTVLDKFKAIAGPKLLYACVEASLQHEAGYPEQRLPTPDEFGQELGVVSGRGVGVCLFPQQTGTDGSGFIYDAMPSGIEAVFSAWARPAQPATTRRSVIRTITITVTIYADGSSDVTSK